MGVAVDVQAPSPTPADARAAALRATGLPDTGWTTTSADTETMVVERRAEDDPVARITLHHVDGGDGYPAAGWVVGGVTACADP